MESWEYSILKTIEEEKITKGGYKKGSNILEKTIEKGGLRTADIEDDVLKIKVLYGFQVLFKHHV